MRERCMGIGHLYTLYNMLSVDLYATKRPNCKTSQQHFAVYSGVFKGGDGATLAVTAEIFGYFLASFS